MIGRFTFGPLPIRIPVHVYAEILVMTKPITDTYFGFILCFQDNGNVNSVIFGSATTDREPNNTNWLRRAIIKIFHYPQSHYAQTFTL